VLKYSHRDFRGLLFLKSTFEYFSFAHFIDFVLVVQLALYSRTFRVVVYVFEDEMLRWFHEDKWLIQNEFVDNFSFNISSPPPAHRICGYDPFRSLCLPYELQAWCS
jgi:hypothetical protein